jgi:mRNA interferase RelE/StbE
MNWRIEYAQEAVKALRKLDPQIRRRVRNAVEALQEDPLRGKPLQYDLKGLRSWRTGDFRIVYAVQDQVLRIFIVMVGDRRDVYGKIRSRWRR